MLILKNLTVKANSKAILRDINFTFEKDKIYAVMGPNGSGKSTLAYAIMGHPNYELGKTSKIIFEGKEIQELSPDKRAKMGLFLSFQTPLSLTGVNIYQLAKYMLDKDPLVLRRRIENISSQLKLEKKLLDRSLNEGSSGGEKKKMEVLQFALIDPKIAIFDEVDTGVDIDALRLIGSFLRENRHERTYILITHYYRILQHIIPDRVVVMLDGRIAKVGDFSLAKKIEEKGYGSI